jgi:deazaflavin-dependent oxidoreductase (nitroreductase family)
MTAAAGAARAADALLAQPSAGRTLAAWAAVLVAGALEATAVGTAQVQALRRVTPLPGPTPRRFVLTTAVVGTLAWVAGSVPTLATPGTGATAAPSWPLLVLAGGALGAVTGCLLGLAQSRTLPPPLRRGVWTGGSTAAWAPAMAVIMLGASTVGAGWPLLAVLAWAAVTGGVAGGLLGLVLGWSSWSLAGPTVSRRLVLEGLRRRRPRRLARSVVGLRVHGRRTGTPYELPVMYAEHDDDLWVAVGHSSRKTWWRNVGAATPVQVLRDGCWRPGVADLVPPQDPRFLNGLAWYLVRWPRTRLASDDPLVRVRLLTPDL